MTSAAENVGGMYQSINSMKTRIIGTWNVARRRERMEKKKIYRDEDSQIIFEFLKEFDKETERRKEFSVALKRKMIEKYNIEQELKKCKQELKSCEEERNE